MFWMVEHFYNATHGLAVLRTYGDICHQYTDYVARKYKDIIVFDGYENMNTKDMTNQRWSKGKAGATVTVATNMTTTMKFLANQKQQFIFMLHRELEKSNCKTYHAPGDADILIVQKAVQSAKTMLVGEDIDLIVLLCYHASLDSHDLFFCPKSKEKRKSFTSGTSELQKKSLVKTSATTSSLSKIDLHFMEPVNSFAATVKTRNDILTFLDF